MKILFLHRNFPAQFRHVAPFFANNPENEVVFITNNTKLNLPNIKKVNYSLKREIPKDCHRYLRFYEENIIHGQSTAGAALQLKERGFVPDIIYGHTWGQTLFMKDIFPDTPLLCYFEWFYNAKGGDIGFNGKTPSIDELAKLRARNAHLLIDLYSCDAGFCPTKFQTKQFPKEFLPKIKTMHDGVDTDMCKPDKNAKFVVKDKNLTFSKEDEVVTYATRGMEAYRGFPEFIKAVEILQKKRPNMHVIIAGEDRVCYGPQLSGTTYKTEMLKQCKLDLDRVHFVGGLPFNEYIKLLQISSAHVYLTYPFVCSWSLLDAMACACPLVVSRTEPILEFVEEDKEGIMFDFYDIEGQVEKIEFALDNKEEMQKLGEKANKKIIENYALKDLLPKHIEFIKEVAGKKRV